jgi:aspartyl-tRNA(Asn)/glutamyl-tRNA(Gln) amidotransferase subunit A
MIGEDILYLSIRELANQIRTKKLSPVELTRSYLDRSEKLGPRFNAYATLTPERALERARAAEKEISAGRYRGLLHGVPYAAKDLLAVKGYPTTWGARPYANQKFDTDAVVIERLDRAGAILIGKAAMIELAGGLGYSNGLASLTGGCRNPWNTDMWTSGSSSGSGAIMAAGLAAFALGSDTRGSIISPATLCGISGMRPSFGRVPRTGVMAIAWSMDKIGPMARTGDCCGLVLSAIAGHDPKDHDSLPPALAAFPYGNRGKTARPLRIGRIKNAAGDTNTEINAAVVEALKVMQQAGASVEEAEISDGPYEEAAELVILIEAASAFWDLIRSGRCAELADPLGQINGYASLEFSAFDYLHIQRVRTFLQKKVDALFDRFDVLAAPGSDSTARPLQPQAPSQPRQPGGAGAGGAAGRGTGTASRPPSNVKQGDGISSLCGLPAITIPCGFSKDRLPIGIQFMGRALEDEKVVAAANLFQSRTDWHKKHPVL